MNTLGIRLLLVCAALGASACTSSTGSSSSGSGAASGDDAGASSPRPAACAYVVTLVTSCFGMTTYDGHAVCDDEPCSEETWDPLPTSAGSDCYGYDEYSSQTDVAETCAQWQARGGFSAASQGDAGDEGAAASCQSNASTGNAACDSCIETNCGSQWCACAADTNVDDAGLPECFGYFDCVATCVGASGSPAAASCESNCAPGYTSEERANGSALVGCVLSKCGTSATCG